MKFYGKRTTLVNEDRSSDRRRQKKKKAFKKQLSVLNFIKSFS